MIVVIVSAPVVAKTALATFAGLTEFVAIVIGLTAIVPEAMDIALQPVFPFIDVAVATVIVIRSQSRRAAR
jgi:hypothetical protein